jgi:hypothetical protein
MRTNGITVYGRKAYEEEVVRRRIFGRSSFISTALSSSAMCWWRSMRLMDERPQPSAFCIHSSEQDFS